MQSPNSKPAKEKIKNRNNNQEGDIGDLSHVTSNLVPDKGHHTAHHTHNTHNTHHPHNTHHTHNTHHMRKDKNSEKDSRHLNLLHLNIAQNDIGAFNKQRCIRSDRFSCFVSYNSS